MRFWAFPTSISVASRSSSDPWAPSMVALTVDRIFSCVPIVGILSQTCSKFVLILLSVHSLASALAILVTSSEASAINLAVAISSRLLPFESWWTSSERRAINTAMRFAAAIISLSFDDHWRTSWWRPWAASKIGWLDVGSALKTPSSSSSVSGSGGRTGGRSSRGNGGRGGARSTCGRLMWRADRSGGAGISGCCVMAFLTFLTFWRS